MHAQHVALYEQAVPLVVPPALFRALTEVKKAGGGVKYGAAVSNEITVLAPPLPFLKTKRIDVHISWVTC